MTPTDFRSIFSGFSDPAAFSDEAIQFWLDVGSKMVNADRWGGMTPTGVGLVAAHYLSTGKASVRSGGSAVGVLTAKTVDKVSASYDATVGSVEGAGEWNATNFGRQYAQLARIYGAGGMQL